LEFEMHLKIVRSCRTGNITVGVLIRQIYEILTEHEGTDFIGIDDLFDKLYPEKNIPRSW